MQEKFSNFRDFYPFYLSQHCDPICRALHFIGTWIVLLILGYVIFFSRVVVSFLSSHSRIWICMDRGHFFFEKTNPPLLLILFTSLIGDWVMWWQLS